MRLNPVEYGTARPVEGYARFVSAAGSGRRGDPGRDGENPVWPGYHDRAPLLALAGAVDLLIIGTGGEIAPLPADLREELEASGLALEIMASPPAARTYNVLLGEGRRVAALRRWLNLLSAARALG
ncbi:MAG: Mth938-like domain-containing protein [Paracoccaceae bacterium]